MPDFWLIIISREAAFCISNARTIPSSLLATVMLWEALFQISNSVFNSTTWSNDINRLIWQTPQKFPATLSIGVEHYWEIFPMLLYSPLGNPWGKGDFSLYTSIVAEDKKPQWQRQCQSPYAWWKWQSLMRHRSVRGHKHIASMRYWITFEYLNATHCIK